MNVKPGESSRCVDPTRTAGRNELNLTINLRQVEQTKSRRIELEEASGPDGAEAEIGRVETNAGFVAITDANGQRFSDGAVREAERRGEKLADLGATPAIVDPILFILRVRFTIGDGGRAG